MCIRDRLITRLKLVERSLPINKKVAYKDPVIKKQSFANTSAVNENHENSALHAFLKLFKVNGTMWMVCFVMFYKLCERAEQTFSMYLVDKQVPTTKLAAWSTILKTCSLLGSTYAGLCFVKEKVTCEIFLTWAIRDPLTI